MVKVRNPWGHDEYHGDWSDHTNGLDEWTDALRTELNHTNDTTDGVIWMTFDYYYANIEENYFNFDVRDWYSATYLKLNDQSLANDPQRYAGSWPWCGSTCTRHKMEITSDVTQDIYLTAHTWDSRQMPSLCVNWYTSKKHGIKRPGDRYVRTFRYGDHQLAKFEMTADQTMEIIVEWNFTGE